MPQLDFSTYPSQVFWFFVFFGLLYLFVSRVFLPKLQNLIKQRQDFISQGEASVLQMELEIENGMKRYQSAIDDARFAAQNIKNEASTLALSMKKDALSSFAGKEKLMYEENQQEAMRFVFENKDALKGIAFDIAMQYYAELFGAYLGAKAVDSSPMKSIVSSGVEKLISGNGEVCQ